MCQETSGFTYKGALLKSDSQPGWFHPTHPQGTFGNIWRQFWHNWKGATGIWWVETRGVLNILQCIGRPPNNYPARWDNRTCFRAEFPNDGTFGLVSLLIWVRLFPVRSLTDAEVKDLLGSDSPLSVIRNVKEKWAWGGFPTVRFNVGAGRSLQWSCPTRPAVVVPLAGMCSGQYLPVATLPIKIYFFIEVKFS